MNINTNQDRIILPSNAVPLEHVAAKQPWTTERGRESSVSHYCILQSFHTFFFTFVSYNGYIII